MVKDGEHIIYVRAYDGIDYSETVSVTIVVENNKQKFDNSDNKGFKQSIVDFGCLAVLIILLFLLIYIIVKKFVKKNNK